MTARTNLTLLPIFVAVVFAMGTASAIAAPDDDVLTGRVDRESVFAPGAMEIEPVTSATGYTVKPASLDFGAQALSTSTSQSFWLRNKGTAPLPITSVSLLGDDRRSFSTNSLCGESVAAGTSCRIRVTFRPTSVGEKSARLRVVAGDDEIRTRSVTGSGLASGPVVAWTDWTAISSRTAAGTMGPIAVTVTSSAAMDGPSQTECGTNYWTQPRAGSLPYTGGSISNPPLACEQVALDSPVTVTVTFSAPVAHLYMALVSAGQPGLAVTYDFDQPFSVDSSGVGYWSGANGWRPGPYTLLPGDAITMEEFHGVLEFAGPVSSLTFTTSPAEYWHGFTLGRAPEPAR